MEIIFGILPVCLFLGALYLFDSFKLVRERLLFFCLLWGIMSAILAYGINTFIAEKFTLHPETFSRYVAPFIEELLKVVVVFYLVARRRIGFAIDAAIYGFAAGAGFSLAENVVYYLQLGSGFPMVVWILRGFGTAIMHGGCTALLAIMFIGSIHRNRHAIIAALPGLVIAIMLHSAYNHFILNPFLQTALIITVLPAILVLVFRQSFQLMQNWLEIEFSSEVDMLRMIRQGRFRDSKAGEYLASIKEYFAPEMIVDMYCYIGLYMELSVKAKRNMMLKENGLPVMVEPDIQGKLVELKMLRTQIGRMGEMALQPLVRMNHRELWKLNQLKN